MTNFTGLVYNSILRNKATSFIKILEVMSKEGENTEKCMREYICNN